MSLPKPAHVSKTKITRGVCRFHFESRDKASITECVHPARVVFIGPGGYLYGACGYHFGQAQRMRYTLHPAFRSGDVAYMESTWLRMSLQGPRVLTVDEAREKGFPFNVWDLDEEEAAQLDAFMADQANRYKNGAPI